MNFKRENSKEAKSETAEDAEQFYGGLLSSLTESFGAVKPGESERKTEIPIVLLPAFQLTNMLDWCGVYARRGCLATECVHFPKATNTSRPEDGGKTTNRRSVATPSAERQTAARPIGRTSILLLPLSSSFCFQFALSVFAARQSFCPVPRCAWNTRENHRVSSFRVDSGPLGSRGRP